MQNCVAFSEYMNFTQIVVVLTLRTIYVLTQHFLSLSICGLVDARISASENELPVQVVLTPERIILQNMVA